MVDPRKTLRALVAAKAKVARPEQWRKDNFVGIALNGGTCYCTLGALYHSGVHHEHEYGALRDAEDALKAAIPSGWRTTAPHKFSGMPSGTKSLHIPHFNDDPATTHEMIAALWDTAIAATASKIENNNAEQLAKAD